MKIRTIISYVMYSYIAKHLPKSKNSYTGFFERIRAFLFEGILISVESVSTFNH